MTWSTNDIEDILMRRPKLAIALMQLLVQRSMDFGYRIESFSVDNIARRLARTLIRFSERLGTPSEDGSVQMIPFTHELLSQYVGTSREIVTHYMNQFRRQGYLRYSAQGHHALPGCHEGLVASGRIETGSPVSGLCVKPASPPQPGKPATRHPPRTPTAPGTPGSASRALAGITRVLAGRASATAPGTRAAYPAYSGKQLAQMLLLQLDYRQIDQ